MTRSRMNCPTHTGAARSVREVLAMSKEPMSVERLSMATGLRRERIKSALSQMVAITGAVIPVRTPSGIAYTLFKAAQEAPTTTPKHNGHKAGRITIGRGSVWGGRVGGQLT